MYLVPTYLLPSYRLGVETRPHAVAIRPPGGGGTPYNGLYGEAPPERGTFFRLQVYKRVGISQVYATYDCFIY